MDLGLTGKVILVAGSSRGIGKSIAESFLQEGAKVVLTGRDIVPLDDTRNEFLEKYQKDRIISLAGDLSSPEHVQKAIDVTLRYWHKIDVLVANVGSGSGKPGWDQGSEEWNRVFDTNFWCSIGLAEAFMPELVKTRGALVFVASITGIDRIACPLTYSSAKAALIHYSKNLAGQVGKDGVRVNCISPGNVLFVGGTWEKKLQQDPQKWQAMLDAEVPLGRFGTPQDIGDVAAFLASERASFMTGSCVVVDGGQTRGR